MPIPRLVTHANRKTLPVAVLCDVRQRFDSPAIGKVQLSEAVAAIDIAVPADVSPLLPASVWLQCHHLCEYRFVAADDWISLWPRQSQGGCENQSFHFSH